MRVRMGCDSVWEPIVTPQHAIPSISCQVIVTSTVSAVSSPGLIYSAMRLITAFRCSAENVLSRSMNDLSVFSRPNRPASGAPGSTSSDSICRSWRVMPLHSAIRQSATTRSGQKGKGRPTRSGQTKIVQGSPCLRAMGKAVVALSAQPSSKVMAMRGWLPPRVHSGAPTPKSTVSYSRARCSASCSKVRSRTAIPRGEFVKAKSASDKTRWKVNTTMPPRAASRHFAQRSKPLQNRKAIQSRRSSARAFISAGQNMGSLL